MFPLPAPCFVCDRQGNHQWLGPAEGRTLQDTLEALMQLALDGPVPAVGFAVVVEDPRRSMMLGPPELEELNAALR